MDDEKVAYPFWEKTRQLGIKNLCVHKGLPLGAFNEKACTPFDLEKAAKDWPDLNFIVYHSAFRGFGWIGMGTGEASPIRRRTIRRSWQKWTSDLLLPILKPQSADQATSTLSWGAPSSMTSSFNPETCMHMLGQMIQVAGADHILWGTDSIQDGSPQSQIERLRRMKMKREPDGEIRLPRADRRHQESDLWIGTPHACWGSM